MGYGFQWSGRNTRIGIKPSGVSLQTFLTRLIWLCTVPLVLLASFLAVNRARQLNDERDLRASHIVTGVVMAIDQDLKGRIGALHMLAQSPLVDDPARWKDLYREAWGFHQSLGSHVVFADRQMHMLFNTRTPFGTVLPVLPRPMGRAAVLTALQTAKPAVGDAFQGPLAQAELITVVVPAVREGRATFLLLNTVETRAFQPYLDAIALPADWSLSVLDSSGQTLVSRSLAGLNGLPITNSPLQAQSTGRFVFALSVAPWSVVVDIPDDAYRAPAIAAIATVIIATLGATLAGLLGGALASRRLGRSVASLAQAPQAGALLSDIVEIAAVRQRLDEVAARRETAEARLRDSEERLRFTLESAHIGNWDLDLITGIGHRSIWHDRCFGYDAVQPLWTFGMFVRHVHPDDRNEVVRTFHAAIDAHADWLYECRVIWPDGSLHWINGHGSTQYENGQRVRMLGIVTEVTQKKAAVESHLTALRLEAENHQILEASRIKNEFLANMSHELRTPLNAIIGFSELLHTGSVPAESPQHHAFLGHIHTSGLHLLQLINDVLDLSKIEAGKFEFFPVPVHLPDLVKEVLDILHTQIQRHQLQISVDIEPALSDPTPQDCMPGSAINGLVLDPGRLKQVLYNYLSNAIKFSHESGRVTVRARSEGATAFRIEIEDNGIGISEADLPRLFMNFQQLDGGSTKQHPGTGLGLALTRRLVEAQGGSVGVRSTRGTGSVFYLVMSRTPVTGPPETVRIV